MMPVTVLLGEETGRTIRGYAINWILMIPIVLGWSKWFFKVQSPSTKRGLVLGLIIIGVDLLLDGVLVLLMHLGGQSIVMFRTMYASWEFYLIILEVVLLTTIAGWEFDRTYTSKE